MNLAQKQRAFPPLVARLITFAYERGYEITFGEAYRPPEVAAMYKQRGIGISNSLHWSKLAIDLNLFRGGKWLTRTEDHRELGEFWESLSTPEIECSWGGHFFDGNHYSVSHNGVK